MHDIKHIIDLGLAGVVLDKPFIEFNGSFLLSLAICWISSRIKGSITVAGEMLTDGAVKFGFYFFDKVFITRLFLRYTVPMISTERKATIKTKI